MSPTAKKLARVKQPRLTAVKLKIGPRCENTRSRLSYLSTVRSTGLVTLYLIYYTLVCNLFFVINPFAKKRGIIDKKTGVKFMCHYGSHFMDK